MSTGTKLLDKRISAVGNTVDEDDSDQSFIEREENPIIDMQLVSNDQLEMILICDKLGYSIYSNTPEKIELLRTI